MSSVDIGPIRADEHAEAMRLRARTFTTEVDPEFDPDDPYAPDDRRVVARDGGRVVGHLAAWDFHQVFGGRPVPTSGIAGVAIAPSHRGQGVASRLLAAGLALARDHGDVVSSLFPATVGPYRAWGWAHGGSHDIREVDTRALLGVPAPEVTTVRPATPADAPELASLARGVAATEPGGLVGSDRWYARRFHGIREDGDGLDVAVRAGEVVGFAEWERRPIDGPGWRLDVGLLVGADADADRALWRQLGSWWSIARRTRFVSRPTDPLLLDLPEHDTRMVGEYPWVTRIVDAPGAVAARGYPDGVRTTVHLHVHDDRLSENDGAFVLEVAEGRGTLTPGGDGHVGMDVRTLATLWTGYLPASVLARRGHLPGATHDDVAALGHAFDAPTPWVREYF